jgi:type I restriction enzyme S subunit
MLKEILKSSISAEWKLKKLGSLIDIKTSRRVFEEDWTDSGVPFYRVRDVVNMKKNKELSPIFISKEKYEELIKVSGKPKIGDILVTGSGSIGQSVVVKTNESFYFRDCDVIWFKINNKINSNYLNFLFDSNFIKIQIDAANNMTTVGHYTIQTAKKTYIPLPHIDVQKQISNYLTENVSKIDNEISLLEKKSILLDEYKNSLIYETVTKGLDKNAEMKDSGVEWMGDVPSHWNIRRIKSFVQSLKTGKEDASHSDEDGVYDFYTCSVKNFKCNDFKFEGSAILLAGNGDISNIKHLKDKNSKFNAYQRVYILQKIKSNERYLYYSFKAGFVNSVRHKQKGSVIEFIKLQDITNFEILDFDINEQAKISNFLDIETAKIEKQIELINKKVELLKEYKQSLIYEAVTGQLEIE